MAWWAGYIAGPVGDYVTGAWNHIVKDRVSTGNPPFGVETQGDGSGLAPPGPPPLPPVHHLSPSGDSDWVFQECAGVHCRDRTKHQAALARQDPDNDCGFGEYLRTKQKETADD